MLRNEQRLGAKVIEKAAAELAATFNVEAISAALIQSLTSTAPGLADLRERLAETQHRAADLLAGMHQPMLTYQEVLTVPPACSRGPVHWTPLLNVRMGWWLRLFLPG